MPPGQVAWVTSCHCPNAAPASVGRSTTRTERENGLPGGGHEALASSAVSPPFAPRLWRHSPEAGWIVVLDYVCAGEALELPASSVALSFSPFRNPGAGTVPLTACRQPLRCGLFPQAG